MRRRRCADDVQRVETERNGSINTGEERLGMRKNMSDGDEVLQYTKLSGSTLLSPIIFLSGIKCRVSS